MKHQASSWTTTWLSTQALNILGHIFEVVSSVGITFEESEVKQIKLSLHFMSVLILNRFLAYVVDYLLIVIYGTVLFFVVNFIGIPDLGPISGQIIAFFTLTLPVFLYFYLMEKSTLHATIGKRFMKLKVEKEEGKSPNYFIRNLFKFLPWEIAHTGVHWMYYYDQLNEEPPFWVWVLLILPQIIMFSYFLSILFSKGRSSLYDFFAGTILNKMVN